MKSIESSRPASGSLPSRWSRKRPSWFTIGNGRQLLGLPCRVSNGRPVEDPQNLGPGWIGYNFGASFGKPVRIMNDAALQALGSYDGGRMLFLGLGTAVGSAYIADHLVLSLDLGRMKYGEETLYKLLGDEGFDELEARRSGKQSCTRLCQRSNRAMMADYVVLGGGCDDDANRDKSRFRSGA